VVHCPIDVFEEAGIALGEEYNIGNTYPVFVLTNRNGDIITRWTGYNGAKLFISALNNALVDQTPVKEKVAQFDNNPTYQKALKLAEFFTDAGEHLDAVVYYRKADSIAATQGRNVNLTYPIFTNTANAAWKEMTRFDDIYPAADDVLAAGKTQDIVNVAIIVSRLTRKFDRPEKLDKYLEAGKQAAIAINTAKMNERYNDLEAERLLQVAHDTAGAIDTKKFGLGKGWQNDRNKFYSFADWCLERRINLPEAEMYAKKAISVTQPGPYRARAYHTVAEICYEEGKTDEAIENINAAISQHPDNPFYKNELQRYENGE